MKFHAKKRLQVVSAFVLTAFLGLAVSLQAAPQQGKAVVSSLKGTAQYSAGGAWAPLKSGMTLYSGTVIQTGSDALLELDLGINGPYVKVKPSTTVAIDKLTFEKTAADTVIETQLDVRQGGIVGKVNKTSSASRYEVKTPTGVAGIRGTIYEIDSDGTVKVKEGCVVVVFVDATGKITTVEVCAGNKFVPGSGTASSPWGVMPMTQAELNSPNWPGGGRGPGGPGRGPGLPPNVFNPANPGNVPVFVSPDIGISPFTPGSPGNSGNSNGNGPNNE